MLLRGLSALVLVFLMLPTQSYWRPGVSLICELQSCTTFSGARSNDFFSLGSL